MYKRFISLILCVSIIFSLFVVASATNKVDVLVSGGECTVGENVTVSVNISENTVVCGGSFTLEYDTNYLELVSVAKQSGFTGTSVTINKAYAANKVRVVWYGTTNIQGGKLIDVVFKTLRDGTTTPTLSTLKLSDLSANALAYNLTGNQVKIKPIYCSAISIVGDTEISEQTKYSADIIPTNATYKDVEWSTSDIDVAIVDDYGNVTPVKNGKFTLIAKATDGSEVVGTKEITIKNQDASDPVFSISKVNCVAGDKVNVDISISSGSSACIGSVIVEYDNSLLKVVDGTKGEALSGISGSVNKSYKENQVKIVWYGSTNPKGGALATLKFETLTGGAATITFQSIKVSNANSNTLKYEQTGGFVSIDSAICEGVTIQGEDSISEATQYTAICSPSTISKDLVHWSVDDSEIAEISNDGVLIPIAKGTVTITAYVDDLAGCYAEKQVYVNPKGIEEYFFTGESTPLSATIFSPEDKNAEIIFASYKGGKLNSTILIKSELSKGCNIIYPAEYDYTDCDTVKVFCFDSMNTIKPLCEPSMIDVIKDTDGDGLPDYQEDEIGTNKEKPDTDGDGLTDYQEVIELASNPLKTDSDDNGISDYDEDFDNDGISNGEEYKKNLNPMATDSDGDGLSDYEEVYTYNTNPLNRDTDDDGAVDGWEVENGTNPLLKDESFDVTASYGSLEEGDTVIASVTTSLDGKSANSLSVEPVSQFDNQMLSSTISGYLGTAYELNTTGEFDSATLSMEYDTSLGTIGEDFEPRIYYYNDSDGTLEELPNQTVENGKVSVQISHFSSYILLNKAEFDKVWETEIKKPRKEGATEQTLDIAFVIDSSGSMDGSDPNDLRKTLTKDFIDKLTDKDRACVIDFDDYASVYSEFTNDTVSLKNAVDGIDSWGGTAIYSGISSALSQFDSIATAGDSNILKVMFVLTDGQDGYSYDYSNLINEANNRNIQIFTVGLGSGTKESLLKSIANGTNGKYYHASTSTDLSEGFETVIKETVDFVTDSNKDGICDYYTELIKNGDLVVSNGSEEFVGIDFGKNADYDGDGLKNGDELIITYNEDKGTVYMKMYSNPMRKDSDGDGYSDKEEKKNGTNPMCKTFDYVRINRFRGNHFQSGEPYYNIVELYDEDPIFRAEQEFFNYGLAGGMYNSAVKQIIDYLYTYCDDELILDETNKYIKMAILDSLNENLKKTNKFIKETKKSVGNLDDFYALISSAVEYKENTEKLIDSILWINENNPNKTYNKLIKILNADYLENIELFKKLEKGTGIEKIDYKIFGIHDKYNTYLDTPVSSSLTKGKVISYTLDAISLGLDIAEDVATFSKINANSKIFQDNLDVLVAIRDNAKHQRVASAAQTVINAMGEGTSSYCAELTKAIAGDVALTVKDQLLGMLLEGNPVYTGYKLAMSAIKLFKWDASVKNCLKIYICEDMRQSIATLSNGEFELLSGNSFYEVSGDENDAIRHLTHMAQLRIIAANTYIDLIDKDKKQEFKDGVYTTITCAEKLNLNISSELLDLKSEYQPNNK